jgi:integrase
MKLSEAIEFVRAVRPTWREGAKGYKTAVINSNHVLEILGDVDIDSITPMSYVNIQDCLKAEGKSNATINRVTSALSTVFSELNKHQMVGRVVRCPNLLRESQGRVSVYSEEDINDLMEAFGKLDSHDCQLVKDVVLTAVKTGARQAELLKLDWDNVRFDENVIIFRDTKSGSDRVLPMVPAIREMMERRYRDGGHVYTSVFPITKDTLYRRFKRVQKLAGVNKDDRCFHTLRHYVCTQLFQNGVPLPDVQAVMGHSQTSTTMRYAHSTIDTKAAALNSLN